MMLRLKEAGLNHRRYPIPTIMTGSRMISRSPSLWRTLLTEYDVSFLSVLSGSKSTYPGNFLSSSNSDLMGRKKNTENMRKTDDIASHIPGIQLLAHISHLDQYFHQGSVLYS